MLAGGVGAFSFVLKVFAAPKPKETPEQPGRPGDELRAARAALGWAIWAGAILQPPGGRTAPAAFRRLRTRKYSRGQQETRDEGPNHPAVAEMERILRQHWPDVDEFPLLHTLATVASELEVTLRTLLRSLRSPQTVLWYRRGKVYVPPDVYQRWTARRSRWWKASR
jgi:hypothetical protein